MKYQLIDIVKISLAVYVLALPGFGESLYHRGLDLTLGMAWSESPSNTRIQGTPHNKFGLTWEFPLKYAPMSLGLLYSTKSVTWRKSSSYNRWTFYSAVLQWNIHYPVWKLPVEIGLFVNPGYYTNLVISNPDGRWYTSNETLNDYALDFGPSLHFNVFALQFRSYILYDLLPPVSSANLNLYSVGLNVLIPLYKQKRVAP